LNYTRMTGEFNQGWRPGEA